MEAIGLLVTLEPRRGEEADAEAFGSIFYSDSCW